LHRRVLPKLGRRRNSVFLGGCGASASAWIPLLGNRSFRRHSNRLAHARRRPHARPVHLAHLRLRDFRNYARLDAEFGAGFHLLLGENAQGKTNILEAVYLLATLRSFRGVGSQPMVRHQQKGYFVGAQIVAQQEHEVKIYWSASSRKISLDGQPVRKLTDYLGTLRAVVFCTEDLLLVKGPGQGRRRFLDLLLTQTSPGYLSTLQRYSQVLRARNALLRQPRLDEQALAAFTQQLISAGQEVQRQRRELCPRLSPLVTWAHRSLAPSSEEFRLVYRSSGREDLAIELAASRARERVLRMTVVGPHRDDVDLLLDDKPAAQFGSEGQKRTLALALKMAQAELLQATHGQPPVLLIDDVMGELDQRRRRGFIPLLERTGAGRGQVFMTSTEQDWPREMGHRWLHWSVCAGTLVQRPG